MKIKVMSTEGMDITAVMKGTICFLDHNKTTINGWIKKIYGMNENKEIVINEAEFIPQNTSVKLDFDKDYDNYDPYAIQVSTVTTEGSYGELKDGKLERFIIAELSSFTYLGYNFKVSEDNYTWAILDEEYCYIDGGLDMNDVLKFMHNTYMDWIKSTASEPIIEEVFIEQVF